MHYFAFFSLLIALLFIVLNGGISTYFLFTNKDVTVNLKLTENVQKSVTFLILLSSVILLYALGVRDFSYAYVHDYTDTFLPLFYALTAFWAGQEGSFLFWLLSIALFGFFFLFTSSYQKMTGRQKVMFWCFYFLIEAFFLLILTGPSNPFLKLSPAPSEGRGLNPLLQNVGMIFHPPLLFLGYAGFTIPACLALAFWLEGEYKEWIKIVRPITILSWVFLSVGIVLGAWWSYMELGWGGYWAWDPVENASLIPWLFGSAYLHFSIIARKRSSLYKTTFFLLHLTLIACFFATFLVRSNVVESLHAFGSGGIAWPLSIFMFIYFLITLYLTLIPVKGKRLDDLWTKSGFIIITSWLFIFLGIIVIIATLWPVFSKLWSDNTVGLDATFYNRVCAPLFIFIAVAMAICFVLDWKGKIQDKKILLLSFLGFFLSVALMLFNGYKNFFSLLGVGSAIFSILTLIWFTLKNRFYKNINMIGIYGLHIGISLIIIGIAISGPFKHEEEFILSPGKEITMDSFNIKYKELIHKKVPGIEIFEGVFDIFRKGKKIGELRPQKRLYAHFEQPFVEVDTYPSLGTEVYISLLGFDKNKNVSVKISLHPAVNWIWIGSFILSICGLMACFSRKKA